MSPVSAVSTPPREGPIPTTAEVQKQTLLDYLTAFGLASQLTQEEKLQFIEVAQAFGLNPFKREIHVAVYGEGEYRRMSIVVGYQVYLDRAERTGQLDGWRAWVEGQGEDMKALVEIHRKDWHSAFIHEVYWKEAVQRKRDGTPTSFWSKMPRFQLKKVAISQGFRLAFPSELGGMPYDPAELPDAESAMPAATFQAPHPEISTMPEVQAAGPATPAPEPAPIQLVKLGVPLQASPVAGSILAGGPRQAYQDPYPDESREQLLERLESYLAEHAESFTDRHYEWVMDKAHKAKDREGVLKMISYSAKVVKNGAAVAGASA
jgi:phage recombination protein Bet